MQRSENVPKSATLRVVLKGLFFIVFYITLNISRIYFKGFYSLIFVTIWESVLLSSVWYLDFGVFS